MRYNTIFFKISFLSILFIFNNLAFATTYYVDATNGSDENLGTAQDKAWKTLSKVQNESSSFSTGDIVGFKRGETFQGHIRYTGPSGTLDNPITFTSYGTGTKPILSGIKTVMGTWKNEGSNKWSISVSNAAERIWRNGVEQKRTSPYRRGHLWEEFGKVADIVSAYYNYKLYQYSSAYPSGTFTATLESKILSFSNKSYINIVGLDLRGGASSVIDLEDCSHINIRDNDIGKDAGYGIVVKRCSNILIERNTFNANFKLTYNGISTYAGTDNRGVNDGIASYGGLTNSEIKYNNFINWGHAGIALETLSSNPISDNLIHHNIFSAPDLYYARAFAFSGSYMRNNKVYNNYIHHMSVRSQMMGKKNHYHHNWFEEQSDTPYKDKEQGQGVSFEAYNGEVSDNIFEYNTIKNSTGPGLELIGDGSSSPKIMNNIIRYNLFDNCGSNSYYSDADGKGIRVQPYRSVGSNIYNNNAFINSINSTSISHRGDQVSPSEYNTRNDIVYKDPRGNDLSPDSISGNTDMVTNQGAGILNLSLIGVTAGKSLLSEESGAFIIMKGILK